MTQHNGIRITLRLNDTIPTHTRDIPEADEWGLSTIGALLIYTPGHNTPTHTFAPGSWTAVEYIPTENNHHDH